MSYSANRTYIRCPTWLYARSAECTIRDRRPNIIRAALAHFTHSLSRPQPEINTYPFADEWVICSRIAHWIGGKHWTTPRTRCSSNIGNELKCEFSMSSSLASHYHQPQPAAPYVVRADYISNTIDVCIIKPSPQFVPPAASPFASCLSIPYRSMCETMIIILIGIHLGAVSEASRPVVCAP